MSLRNRNGETADLYRRVSGQEGADANHVLVPFEALAATRLLQAGNQQIGIEIANSVKLAALLPVLDQVSLIAVQFPGFGDGRGFSIAKSLRNRGFRGVLRAVGPLIADQFAYAIACGFDEVELPEALATRQPVGQWMEALGAISATYQRSHSDSGRNILEKRRAARERRGS